MDQNPSAALKTESAINVQSSGASTSSTPIDEGGRTGEYSTLNQAIQAMTTHGNSSHGKDRIGARYNDNIPQSQPQISTRQPPRYEDNTEIHREHEGVLYVP